MASTAPRPLKVEGEFTDARLTGFGGWSALALTAERLGLFGDLSEGVSVKVRRRGIEARQTTGEQRVKKQPTGARARHYERPLPRPPPWCHHMRQSRHLLVLIVALFSSRSSRHTKHPSRQPPPLPSTQQTPKPAQNAPPHVDVRPNRRQVPSNSTQQTLMRELGSSRAKGTRSADTCGKSSRTSVSGCPASMYSNSGNYEWPSPCRKSKAGGRTAWALSQLSTLACS